MDSTNTVVERVLGVFGEVLDSQEMSRLLDSSSSTTSIDALLSIRNKQLDVVDTSSKGSAIFLQMNSINTFMERVLVVVGFTRDVLST